LRLLLVDIGNTRIKWARLEGERLGRADAASYSSWTVKEFERRLFSSPGGFGRVVVASVAPVASRKLSSAARRAGAPRPEIVATRRSACGVTIGYDDPWRLGVDRFMAIIGAHQRFRGRPVCAVAVGTAMTVDLVGADGRHIGGAIIPGPTLMRSSLLDGTRGIRRRARGGSAAGAHALFGRSTRAAVEQGTRFAAAAAVDRAVSEARELVGRAPLVVLTGGGAAAIEPLIRSAHAEVPDLVLRGLAAYAIEIANPTN
jgi:type III pantothenate kinase